MRCRTSPVTAANHVDPAALFALLTVILILVSHNVLADGDTYTHVAAGLWMIEHRSVLTHDPFTSTFAGHAWDAHEWLSEMLLAIAYRLAGLTGVVLLTAAAVAIAFANLARHIARWAGWMETMVLTAGALLCVLPNILARPHILALPLLELWIAELLFARRDHRSPAWWLLPLMVIWANMHGGFAFGLAIVLPLAVEATLERSGHRDRTAWLWWGFLISATIAALITPQFLNGLLFPFRLLRLHNLASIKEWQATDFSTDIGFDVVLLGLLILLCRGQVRLPLFRVLLLAGLLALTLAHRRHSLLFGIAGALILAEPVGRAFNASIPVSSQPIGRGLCWSSLALAVVVRLAHPIAIADSPAAPVSALAQLPPGVGRMDVLNSYQFGGYLAFVGMHPFIDGRAELFGDAFLSEFLALSQLDSDSLRRRLDRRGIAWAILAATDPLVVKFDGMTGWRRHHIDNIAVVFIRSRTNPS